MARSGSVVRCRRVSGWGRDMRNDITGKKFNMLTAVRFVCTMPDRHSAWEFLCDCGNTTVIPANRVTIGKTKSCGCQKHAGNCRTHGMSRTNTYESWLGMRSRCGDPSDKSYSNYGGRGISVCERWSLFENFLADMGACPKGLSIERLDNNGDYEPCNCIWADSVTQSRNRRNVKLTPSLVRIIRASKETQQTLADRFGVTQAHISSVQSGLTWKDVV